MQVPSTRPATFLVTLGLALFASGCFDAGSASPPRAQGCHLHSSRLASASTLNYRVLVGLAPARRITPPGATRRSLVATEADRPAAPPVASRVHLDVEICTTTGVPLALDVAPSVRLSDGSVASIDVPMTRLRPADEHERAHFGANVAMIDYGPVVATVAVDGERASVLLRPGSPGLI